MVLEIYRITLLSNKIIRLKRKEHSFRDLQNYTTLKLICGIKVTFDSFRDLQNYTTLKLQALDYSKDIGFRDLQNYTTLKLNY